MYKVEIETKKGKVVIYLENLLNLEEELKKYPEHEQIKATKVLTK